MTTGQRLKMLREQRGQSQADIAKLIGVGRTTYLKYESGENKPTRKLKELSALFNVTSDYIMGFSDDPHGTMVPEGKGFFEHYVIDPPPEFFTIPETGKRIEAMNLDPKRKRIIIASRNLQPEELDRIAELMETMGKAHSK